jgi:putative ABC transport system permease protein
MTGFLQDVRFAFRQIPKNPGFAATAIVVLALGLGATTGMLAIVQSVLVRPLNYHEPERLMLVGVSDKADSTSKISYLDFRDMERNLHQFQSLAAYFSFPFAVQTDDGAQMLVAPAVTTNFFDLMGIQPSLGRGFRPGDEAVGAGSVVLSHEFWQHSMHGRQDILGRELKINSELYTVVGVMPPHFQFPMQTETLWTTFQMTPGNKTKQGFDEISVLGRLKPGATVEQARSEGEAFLRNKANNKNSQSEAHFWVYPYQKLVTGDERPAILALLAACFLLLLIAVVNTANLQIARAAKRETEIAVRVSLGATRVRILRQLIAESLVLSLAGATLGWLLAMGFVEAARHLFSNYARFDELQLDSSTFAACVVLTLTCGVLAALAPAWHILKTRRNLAQQQNSVSGRVTRSHRLSGVLVVAEVALTSVLLVAAGLFLRTFRSLQNVPLGFTADHVTTFVLWPQGGNIALPAAQAAFQRTLDRLQATPGVEAAGMVTSLPISNFQITVSGGFSIPAHIAPDQKNQPQVKLLAATSGYLRAMSIPLLSGRPIADSDIQSGQMVGVVNKAFVDNYLPGTSPLGQQIVLEKDAEFPQPITIVGVAADVVQNNSIGTPPQPEVYVPLQQLPASGMIPHFLFAVAASFAVRSTGNLPTTANDIRAVVKNEAPEFAIDGLGPISERVDGALKTRRLAVEITTVFAWVALLLSAAGLYGVLAYLVGQRIHEMGIRLALGATRENVFALIVRQGLWMVGAGLGFGLVGALLAARWIRSFLYGTTIHDPFTYALAGALVLLASAIAILLPARRAASVEPMVALRYE